MSRAKNGSNPRFNNGKKVRSIYSPGWQGSRIPEGKPGNQRPLLDREYLVELHNSLVHRVPRRPVIDPATGQEWVD
jgi:hypothetical protein